MTLKPRDRRDIPQEAFRRAFEEVRRRYGPAFEALAASDERPENAVEFETALSESLRENHDLLLSLAKK